MICVRICKVTGDSYQKCVYMFVDNSEEFNKLGNLDDFQTSNSNHTVQRELFVSEVNSRETMAAIEVNNDTYCL